MIATCKQCGVNRVSPSPEAIQAFQARHQTNCPGPDTSLFPSFMHHGKTRPNPIHAWARGEAVYPGPGLYV